MTMHLVTGWGVIGAVKEHTIDKRLPWYLSSGTDMAIGYIASVKSFGPFGNPFNWTARHVGRLTHAGVRRGSIAGRHVVRGAARSAWAGVSARASFTAGTLALYTSAVAVGYAIGAVVGTGVSQALFGDRGARHAIDFYTGQGKYGEYFDIVGNFNTVYNALKQGDI